MSAIRLYVTLLPCRFRVVKIDGEENLRRGAKLTGDETTLIVSDEDLAAFPSEGIVPSDFAWRAMQLSGEGSLGFESSGIVQSVAAPLAAADISIFYLSTFETDFFLVPETRVKQTLEVLGHHFTIQSDHLDDLLVQLPPQSFPEPNAPVVPKKHPISTPPGEYVLASIPKEVFLSVAAYLLPLIFAPASTRTFFSYVETESVVSDEVSLILNQTALALLPRDSLHLNSDSWRLLKVADGPLGFEESGIVSSIATALGSAGISLFYVSTFTTDYVLVDQRELSKAIICLNKAEFVLK